MNNQGLYQQLMEAFGIEAKERIESMFANLTALEKAGHSQNRKKLIEIIYREAHSLKGAARSVNIPSIEQLCQVMEGLFSRIKEEEIALSPDLFDTLHLAVGTIEKFLASDDAEKTLLGEKIEKLIQSISIIIEAKSESGKINRDKPDDLIEPEPDAQATARSYPTMPDESTASPPKSTNLEKKSFFDDKTPQKEDQAVHQPKMTSGETVRISSSKLDSLLLKTEELIVVKQILNQHLEQIKKIVETTGNWKVQSKKAKSKLKESDTADRFQINMNRFYQFVETNDEHIDHISSTLKNLSMSLEQNNRVLGGMVDDLLEEVKNISLLPFSSLFAILPRMVRDIAREQGKDIDIEISGGDVEIDKRILESLKDPIIHLIRNAVDHGIENQETRKQMGKPPWGIIRLSVTQPEGHKVEMDIADDGSGINVDSIKKIALKKGVVSAEYAANLDDKEALMMIFQSGISTSPIITEISGRGLGMAIVKETVEMLGGSISIINRPTQGTTFNITLPVTLATFRGILVSASGYLFIVPNAHVQHILKIKPSDIKTAENRAIISFNGSALSLVKLVDILGLPHHPASKTKSRKSRDISHPTIIMTNGDIRIAVIVDQIINEQEVLVKNLGKQIKHVPNISGATILATGKVVPILNIKDLIRTASGKAARATVAAEMIHRQSEPQKSVLIVEDSFTSRTLLKNILETSGYAVKTAIDGEDGYNQLKAQIFDAVVSDVQMPKMDGFELTRKIRGDNDLADMPVILVTSLDSPADREKGIDVGANAYIVKSNFDQSNLLEVLERII